MKVFIAAVLFISSPTFMVVGEHGSFINGVECMFPEIIGDYCEAGDPNFDVEGMVCANDGTKYEAYCSYEIGPNACARCKMERPIINENYCDDPVVVHNFCKPGNPHFDVEGSVCAHDGTEIEAYCSYNVGPNACAYCPDSPDEVPEYVACRDIEKKRFCKIDPNCKWLGKEKGCGYIRACAKSKNFAECKFKYEEHGSRCYWDTKKGKCIRDNCDSLSRKECKKIPTCSWSKAGGCQKTPTQLN